MSSAPLYQIDKDGTCRQIAEQAWWLCEERYVDSIYWSAALVSKTGCVSSSAKGFTTDPLAVLAWIKHGTLP
jgi:hypothetical protein